MKYYDEGTVIGAVYHALRTTLLGDDPDKAKMAVAVEIANKLPTADVREMMNSAWIPVTERLPEVYTMYLVTLDDGSVYFLYWEWDDDFKHWVDEEGNGDYIVTAWMPLPKSFKP